MSTPLISLRQAIESESKLCNHHSCIYIHHQRLEEKKGKTKDLLDPLLSPQTGPGKVCVPHPGHACLFLPCWVLPSSVLQVKQYLREVRTLRIK